MLVIVCTQCGRVSFWGHFSSTPGTGGAKTVSTVVWRCQAKPSNVLNQDISRPFPNHQFPRSRTLGMVPAQRRGINVRGRVESMTPSSTSTQLSTPISASSKTTTWPRFQHHAAPTHHINERGRCRGDLHDQPHAVQAAVGSSQCGIL